MTNKMLPAIRKMYILMLINSPLIYFYPYMDNLEVKVNNNHYTINQYVNNTKYSLRTFILSPIKSGNH